MYRSTLLILTTLFLTFAAQAQIPGAKTVTAIVPKFMLGIKAGGNFGDLSGDSWKQSYQGGFVGGLFVGFHWKRFGVQGEALVRSAKFDIDKSDASVATFNLDVPVMLEYKLIPRLWLQLGPQFTDKLSETDKNTPGTTNVIKTSGFDGVIGLQAILPIHLIAGARYIVGLSDLNNHAPGVVTEAWKNRAFQLYLGFRFI